MPLSIPNLDDRSFEQIVQEAIARIPVHTPEWTNHNESDPGITLLQLFAFMTESLLYRSNQIPERNRKKFLALLGLGVQPAQAARGFVQFTNTRGPLAPLTLPEGLELYAGNVPFRTQNALAVQPLEAQVFYKSRLPDTRIAEIEAIYAPLFESFLEEGVELAYYETKRLEPPSSQAVIPAIDIAADTVGEALWIALLARDADQVETTRAVIANSTLTLAILPALDTIERTLNPARTNGSGQPHAALRFEIPNVPADGMLPTDPALRVAAYRELDARPSTDLLAEPGTVQLVLPEANALRLWANLEPSEQGTGDFPPAIEDTDIAERIVTWIRVRIADDAVPEGGQVQARISWLGINSVPVVQYARIVGEVLGVGNGEPDQRVQLSQTPVLPDSLVLTVGGERWERIDDLLAAGPEVSTGPVSLLSSYAERGAAPPPVNVFTLDPESGLIQFGTGVNGRRPPIGARIHATYDYGGGRQGVVGIGAINKGALLPAGVKVSNPLPTWGGDDPETVDEAERRIPAFLRHQDRLVSADDFRDITERTPGVDIGRVDVLPLFHPDRPTTTSAGVVTVMVIPKYDPLYPDAPRPNKLFLDTVCAHLNPRRLVTTEVHVRGPIYKRLWVSVGVNVIAGRDIAPVHDAVRQAVRTFLSPLVGGFDETGWPRDTQVDTNTLLAVVARVDGVQSVNEVQLGLETGGALASIAMQGLELPHLVGISVASGSARPLDTVRGTTPPGDGDSPRLFPVPVVPESC